MGKMYFRFLTMILFFENISSEFFQKSVEDYQLSISESTIKQNFRHKKTFYQNPLFNKNPLYYNKGIPRSGKKIGGEYVSIQSQARDRRKKIRKILEGKI